MWGEIFRLNEELKSLLPEEGFKVEDVEGVFGAYIFVEGSWEQMLYPHPAFEIKPGIEVGATPDGYYFVIAVPGEKVSEGFVSAFLELFPRSFIYGSENFLSDVYNWRRDERVSPTEILEKINESGEKVFQFEANFGSADGLREGIFKLIELGKRFEIFDI
ncbi:DUF3201 domain-containing protein [Palaeococcus ferrophilus]|uniref:DUF3201 domain-containing protein n=1 Tax=Palaeococcus ferrophilus TaxID=83868 RepID=UPI00064EE1B3|nr:DUF3201 domain-containing protein [Palaeococcus ferrophilus]